MLKKLNKITSFLLISLVSITFISATVNVIDVSITENVYQEITYNPLGTTTGNWVASGENQLAYDLTGHIEIKNTHPTDSIQNVAVRVDKIANIYNLTYNTGIQGYITELNYSGDFATLFVGDLAAGQSSNFTYNINGSLIASPIDISASYDANVLSGLDFPINKTLTNRLAVANYSNNCVYDIILTEDSLTIGNFGTNINFTFVGNSLGGNDLANANIDPTNRTLTWNTLASGCLNSTETTDISYNIKTPFGFAVSDTYEFSNSTLSYSLNSTVSQINVTSIAALSNIKLEFQKYQQEILTGDNATWRISSNAFSDSTITVNLTSVSFWVSTRNGTGTGFTNPSIRDNDTISGAELFTQYNPNILLNSTTGNWNNTGSEWLFNYTFSSSPIVWMDLENNVFDDGIQLTDREITYGNNEIYIKEIYVAVGYWLEIKKNITRLGDSQYNVVITVSNLGSSPTPAGQVVVVYNFIPNLFNLTSSFQYSASPWFNVTDTNTSLSDVVYNGTMYQYGLLPNGNLYNTSFDSWIGLSNENNSLTITYNLSGEGEFNFDDLFLTGVDPLQVDSVGGTSAVSIEGIYKVVSSNTEYILSGLAVLITALVFLF